MTADLPQLTSMDDMFFGPLATPWDDFTDNHATGGEALVRDPMGWLLGRGLVQRSVARI
ncbi:hypothetical protein ABZZ79_28870 [Streptomyces sp. NPDC006458]|uniref:hypothetical protein n=1 Tax=Streptomyces sp. NPDC006458 TaxID=3154302 RepID=UPI0033AF3F92